MREFLSDPLFWMRETLRWHWRDVLRDVLWWTPIVLGAITLSHLVT